MIITQTPLRISFLGGNTDFPAYFERKGGCVLTTAIDKYIYCIVKKRFDDLIRVNYSIKESVTDIKDLKHELVREAMKLVGVTKGIEITFLSDIPSEGSGLGSSSSVTVGILNALHHYKGESVNAEQLAREACRIEIGLLKKPIGVQDQYIAAYGGLRDFIFSKAEVATRPVQMTDVAKEEFNNSLMMFYTGVTRKSSSVLSKMKLNDKILDKTLGLALKGIEALSAGEINVVGQLLDDYWKLKKSLNKHVSNSKIDDMYKKAKKAGAIGGKILGAGGGGFMLLVVDGNKTKVRAALKDYKELPFRFAKDGSKVIFDNGSEA